MTIEPGTPVKVKGIRGKFIFRHMNKDGSAAVFGGPRGQWRSFALDRITVVGGKKADVVETEAGDGQVQPKRRPRQSVLKSRKGQAPGSS